MKAASGRIESAASRLARLFSPLLSQCYCSGEANVSWICFALKCSSPFGRIA